MKLRNFFAVTVAAATLFSCTTEIINVVEAEKEAGTTRLKVEIAPNVETTRAGHATDGTLTEDELKIYNYALFIFNSSGMLEASLTATPYSTANGTTTPKDYDYSTNSGLTFTQTDNPNLDDEGILTLSAGTKMFFLLS